MKATAILAAGFGLASEIKELHEWPVMWLNQSRIITNASCRRKFTLKYRYGYETPNPPYAALSIGRLWHGCVERIEKLSVAEIVRWATIEARAIDYGKYPTRAKELEKFLAWLEHALPLYKEWTKSYEIIAREQPFWLVLRKKDGKSSRYYGYVGTIDAIGLHNGRVANFEFKTVSERENVTDFLAMRSKHVQDALYFLALRWLYKRTPKLNKAGSIPSYTVYELVKKVPYPMKSTKTESLDERREKWPKQLFHRQQIYMDEDECYRIINLHARNIPKPSDYSNMEPNYGACRNFSNRACEFFDYCWNDCPLEEPYFQKREPDYVDGLRVADPTYHNAHKRWNKEANQ